MKKILRCPICAGDNIIPFIDTHDLFLTHESFSISRCNDCGFLLTNPIPEINDLGNYYKSDEYLSHSKANKGALSKLYSFIRNYSIKRKYQLISAYTLKGSILDIGCGTGEVLHYFDQKGWMTLGIEPSDIARKYAIENFDLLVKDEDHISTLTGNSFDVVSMWHVLEHVPQLNERMKQLRYILKDEGTAFIALPNCESWDAKYYKKEWAAWDVPRHLYHFSKDSFSKLATKHGFKIEEILPMKFDAFYVSLLSEKYRSKKMNYIKALFNGLKSNFWAQKNDNNYSSLIYVLKKDLSQF